MSNMQVGVPNAVAAGRRRRRLRRGVTGILPFVVWCLAIVAAIRIYGRSGSTGVLRGYAEDITVTLTHPEPAVVQSVHVRLYDPVDRGQMLISLDDREERIQLAAIEKDLERLQADVAAQQTALALDNRQVTVDLVDLGRRFAVDREAAHVQYLSELVLNAKDRMALRGAMTEHEILRQLDTEGSASIRELNDVRTEVEVLQAAIETDSRNLERMQEAFLEADKRWAQFVDQAQPDLPFEPVLAPLRLAIEVRRRDLEEIVRRIDTHVLRSPIEGNVTALLAQHGDSIVAGAPLVKVSSLSTNRVLAFLPERMAASVSQGTPVAVICVAPDGQQRRQYAGTVQAVSATVSEAPIRYRQVPNYPVWGRGIIVVLDDYATLIPGEPVIIEWQQPDRGSHG